MSFLRASGNLTALPSGPTALTGLGSKCAAWSSRTGIPTIVLRPVMILTDWALLQATEDDAERSAFVHADDVAAGVEHRHHESLVG